MTDEIDFENFCEFALGKITETDEFEQLKKAFSVFDPENEGTVPTERFRRWMTSLGDRLSDQEAKELAKLGDAAGKGVIVYEDLIALLLGEK